MQTENTYVETDLGNIALNPRGEYSGETSYEHLDTVSYMGGSYVRLAELTKTISGIAPAQGKNTEHWQMLTLPGQLTPEAVAMHDDVVNKAKQVETSRAAVELSQREVEAAQTDVSQMRQDTQDASQMAIASRDSAAGYAQSAEISRTAAKESEDNVKAQESKVVQSVIDEGTKQIKAVSDKATEQIGAVNTAGSTQVSTIETEGADQVKAIQEAGENALQNISNGVDKGLSEEGKAADAKATGEAISKLTEDIDNLNDKKITKFYASNLGETHITDSDNGKIQDMMLYGKSSQDGTPTPENPVEIKSVVNPTIKLIGSNILKIMDGEYQSGGVTAIVSNGVVKLKGTANDSFDINLTANFSMFFEEGTEIIFSPNRMKGIEGQNNCYLDFSNNNTKGFSINNNNINAPYIIKKEDAKYPFELYIRCSEGATLDEIWKPQILIGKTSTPFKPYTEQTITLPITLNAIPVSSGGNVTLNGQQYVADYVDVERGKVVRMCGRETLNTKNGKINEEYRLSIDVDIAAQDDGSKECIFSAFKWTGWGTCVAGTKLYIKEIKKPNNEFYTAQELKELSLDFEVVYQLAEKQETDLPTEQITAFKALATHYPTTNISVNSEQLDGYTVFNYPISMANGWNYVKQQLNDNRDYIYDMDVQSAEAYVNSEYAVALTELEV